MVQQVDRCHTTPQEVFSNQHRATQCTRTRRSLSCDTCGTLRAGVSCHTMQVIAFPQVLAGIAPKQHVLPTCQTTEARVTPDKGGTLSAQRPGGTCNAQASRINQHIGTLTSICSYACEIGCWKRHTCCPCSCAASSSCRSCYTDPCASSHTAAAVKGQEPQGCSSTAPHFLHLGTQRIRLSGSPKVSHLCFPSCPGCQVHLPQQQQCQ